MRTKILVRFGTISSVIDMMRYDQCYPATEDDSRKLEKSQIGGGKRTALDHIAKFMVCSPSGPTPERWASFGCVVLATGTKAVDKKLFELEEAERLKHAGKTT